MGKEPAEVDLDQLEQKAGTTIKNDIDAIMYKSKNTSEGIVSDDDFDWSDFLENNKEWYKQYNSLVKDITWDNLNKDDHFTYMYNYDGNFADAVLFEKTCSGTDNATDKHVWIMPQRTRLEEE